MADWAVPRLGGKTLLQYAHTPYMDELARLGRTGMLQTVAEGFHPGRCRRAAVCAGRRLPDAAAILNFS